MLESQLGSQSSEAGLLGSGRGQGQMAALQLPDSCFRVPLPGRQCIPRAAAAAGGCLLHATEKPLRPHVRLGSSAVFFLEAWRQLSLKHKITKRRTTVSQLGSQTGPKWPVLLD